MKAWTWALASVVGIGMVGCANEETTSSGDAVTRASQDNASAPLRSTDEEKVSALIGALQAAGLQAGFSSASTAYGASAIACGSGAIPGGALSSTCSVDWYVPYGRMSPQHLELHDAAASSLATALATAGAHAIMTPDGSQVAVKDLFAVIVDGRQFGGGKSYQLRFNEASATTGTAGAPHVDRKDQASFDALRAALTTAGVQSGLSSASVAYSVPSLSCGTGAIPGGQASSSCALDWAVAYGPPTTYHVTLAGDDANAMLIALIGAGAHPLETPDGAQVGIKNLFLVTVSTVQHPAPTFDVSFDDYSLPR